MFGLRFEDQPQRVVSDPNRFDIACFVGYIQRRQKPLPPEVARWLYERGWLAAPNAEHDLRHVPIPIDTWEVFDLLFAWEARALGSGGQTMPTYLGAAVRSFFAQGGRKCYVVRVNDPWPYIEVAGNRDQRINTRLNELLPGYKGKVIDASPVDPSNWKGVAHLFGLSDVSFISLPDLAEIVRGPEPTIEPMETLPPEKEQFVECSDELPAPPADRLVRRVSAPRCDESGYKHWTSAISICAQFLYQFHREVQLVAALPLPEKGSSAEEDLIDYLNKLANPPWVTPAITTSPKSSPPGMASAFVQLCYPWPRTSASSYLPEALESPDGVLCGLLARNALERGTFRSAASLPPVDIHELTPSLRREQIEKLGRRTSLFVLTPDGLRLFSDVTTSLQSSHRQAHVNRLISAIVRAARRLGEDLLFESSGERLWAQVQQRLLWLLDGFRDAGALRAESTEASYFVRCDRSTMTQNDIDNGRIIAQVQIDPAASVEGITIVLALDEGGQVSLVGQA